ncbi:MAG: serine/threonine-protein kinase [Gemmatimonadales bacterium]
MTAPAASDLRARLARALGDRYVLADLLGRGGFAEVWKAREVTLDRDVAVKVLRPELADNAEVAERFLREARAMARLAHPHIVQIYATGEHERLVWVTMQFVGGESLRTKLERVGALTTDEAVRVLDEAAQALHAAHAAGIIHRDVKPDNILLDGDGRALLTDFGIARAQQATSHTLTGTGLILGTPHYMSPEQGGGGDDVDQRADLYSLGVVGYQVLAGRLPFEADGVLALLMKHATEQHVPLANYRPDVPPHVIAAIERCLRKRPDDRWATAEAFRDGLRRGSGAVAAPEADPRVPERTRNQQVRRALLIGAVVALGAVVADVLIGAGGLLAVGGVLAVAFGVAVVWGDVSRTSHGAPSGAIHTSGFRLRADRAALLTMLTRVPKAEREPLGAVRRAFDDLLGRADELERSMSATRAGRPDEDAGIQRARAEQELKRLQSVGTDLRRAARRVWADGYARAAPDVDRALATYAEAVRRVE